jgi:hypothetical protein
MTQQLQNTTNIGNNTRLRIPTIIDGILNGQTHQQIANNLNINRITLEDDLTKFVHSPEWTTWLAGQWIELYNKLRRTDKEQVAFNGLTQLLKRSAVQVNIQQNNLTAIRVVLGNREYVTDETGKTVTKTQATSQQ